MIEKWEFSSFSCGKDPQRYKLKLKAEEKDVFELVGKIGANCGRPFPPISREFNWMFYVYNVGDREKSAIEALLQSSSPNGRVESDDSQQLEISEDLPPMLEDLLEVAANEFIQPSLESKKNEKIAEAIKKKDALIEDLNKVIPIDKNETIPARAEIEESGARQADKKIEIILGKEGEQKNGDEQNFEEKDGDIFANCKEVRLIPNYTFEEFIVGPNNRFTHAAALAVAESPGRVYNPFFIYGGVGLGKTHLMHAIGHYLKKKNPAARILYVTTERFTSEVIEAIRRGKIQAFRNYYRSLDLLLIDDVQFLVESEATQEEFFHTFNILHESQKQIVLSSDRPPKQLTTLEDRLRSRFEWGLIADMKLPNLETRVAILKKKKETENLPLTENMLLYIASRLKSNIRELEGFLKRISAYTKMAGQEITMELIQNLIKDLLPEEGTSPAPVSEPLNPKPVAIISLAEEFQSATLPNKGPDRETEKKEEKLKEKEPEKIELKTKKEVAPPTNVESKRPAPAADSAEDVSLKPVEVAFFYPEGKEEELTKMKERFKEVIKKHKLKFRLVGIFEQPYSLTNKIDYAKFCQLCKNSNTNIAIVLGPSLDAPVQEADFTNMLSTIFEEEKLFLLLVPFAEISKDFRYLNLALDITLIRH